MHVGDAVDYWCNRISFEDYKTNTCTGTTWYSGLKPSVITKTTNIKSRNSGDSILKRKLNPPVRCSAEFAALRLS